MIFVKKNALFLAKSNSADQRAKQKEKDCISRGLSKSELHMEYSLCFFDDIENNFALLSVICLLAVSTYSFKAG